MLNRRTFIKALAILSGGLLVKRSNSKKVAEVSQEEVQAGISTSGEHYGGFLLLPEEAPIPPTVKPPQHGIPIVCGVGTGENTSKPTAESRSFNSGTSLAQEVNFPIYAIEKSPEHIRPFGAYLIKHKSGEPFAAAVNFQTYNEKRKAWETTLSIWSQPDFPKPFPLWSSKPVEPGAPSVILHKVNFLPSPGIMVITQRGWVFHWIENNILYTFIAEFKPSHKEVLALVPLLARIK